MTGRLPVRIVAESADVLAFKHTQPTWETRIVVIPKRHVRQFIKVEDAALFSESFTLMTEIIRARGFAQTNYKIIINGGSCQSTQHLHFQLDVGCP